MGERRESRKDPAVGIYEELLRKNHDVDISCNRMLSKINSDINKATLATLYDIYRDKVTVKGGICPTASVPLSLRTLLRVTGCIIPMYFFPHF